MPGQFTKERNAPDIPGLGVALEFVEETPDKVVVLPN
jgi:hypothetical protein